MKLGDDIFAQFPRLTPEEEAELERRWAKFHEELSKDMAEHNEKMRRARLKSMQLAMTRVIG